MVRGEAEKRAPSPYGRSPQPQTPHSRRGLGRIGVLLNFALPLLAVGTVGLQRQGTCTRRQQLLLTASPLWDREMLGRGGSTGDEQRGEMNRAMGLEQKAERRRNGVAGEGHRGVGQSHP